MITAMEFIDMVAKATEFAERLTFVYDERQKMWYFHYTSNNPNASFSKKFAADQHTRRIRGSSLHKLKERLVQAEDDIWENMVRSVVDGKYDQAFNLLPRFVAH